MSDYVSLDHPGILVWFHGYGPAPVVEHRCVHGCEHRAISEIAYGPSERHYLLYECDHCGCRTWLDVREWSIGDRVSPWSRSCRVDWKTVGEQTPLHGEEERTVRLEA